MKTILALICATCLTGWISAEQKDARTVERPKTGLIAWIQRVCAFKFDPMAISNMLAVRGLYEQLSGDRISMADIQEKQAKVFVECRPCWSPALAGANALAFLKPDGIWLASIQHGDPTLALPASNVIELVGSVADRPNTLLVLLRTASDAHCYYKLAFGDLDRKQLNEVPDGPGSCLSEADSDGVIRPDTVHGSSVLYTSTPTGGPRFLLLQAGSGRPSQRVLPWIDEQDDGIDRFDPVWISDTKVAYVEKQ